MRRNAWKYWLISGALVIAGYFALPGTTSQLIVVQVVAMGAVAAILLGTALHRPADRLGWYLVALGFACFAMGAAAQNTYELILHQTAPFPSIVDAFRLAGYPLVFIGILRLTRSPNRPARKEDNADGAIMALASLTIWWQFVMNTPAHAESLALGAKVVTLAYPIMDVLLVFIVCRALLFGRLTQTAHKLLAGTLATLFAADLIHDLLTRHDQYSTGNAVDALFLLVFVLMGAAALHPSMAEAVAPPPQPPANIYIRDDDGRRRIPVVAFAGFVPPSMLLVASCFGVDVNVPVVSGICIGVFALIYLRMMWLIGTITGQTNEIEVHARALEASLRQREALESDLRHLAFHDELTGLANRALLHDRVEQALASSPRTGQSVALCFGDLDGFKTVNDTLGHHVGDNVLVRASRLLSSIVRPGDTVARLGGDEFAVLMVDVGRPDAAVDFAHRIVGVLRDAPDFEGTQVGLSISVGVAYGEPGKSTEQLLSEADSAMYEAKETRQEPGRGFPGLHAVTDAGAARPDQRVPLGARSLRVLPRVPADRLPGRPAAPGLRGPGALEPSDPRRGRAPPVHPHRRRDRFHRAPGTVGAGRGVRTAGRLECRVGGPVDPLGQPVEAAARVTPPDR